jgi:hypothetical protein
MYQDGTCPVCNQSHTLSYVGNILDSGTMNTQGMFVGINMGGEGGLIPGFQFSTSMSDFTRRFTPPRRPGSITLTSFMLWWMIWFPIATIAIRYWIVPSPSPDFIYWLITTALFATFGAPLAFPLALITVVLIRIIRNREYKYWQFAHDKLRRAMYCSHDNVVFDFDTLGYPEDFIRHVFFETTPAKYAIR